VRSVSQLSGGEWRRVGLALSLAYAQFAQARAAVSSNLLVLDEAMGGMDANGQAAMAELLRALPHESILVIAHGLQRDTLYGEFDAVDTVERVGEASSVRVGDAEMSVVGS
jgi:ABC-type cobalamin transport system ATPase subunit